MKTLLELQNEVLSIRKELELLQLSYYDAETEEQEELLENQIQALEDKRTIAEKELKECCYNKLSKNGLLSNDIKDMFVKSEKNATIENKLIDLLLKM